jgi:hypothetical protein
MTNCPRCHQPLPEPRERFCIHCGTPLDAVPEPEPGPADAAAAEDPGEPASIVLLPSASSEGPEPGVPWDRRGEIGFFTALVDTTLQVLSKPREFYRRMAIQGGLGGPLAYGVLVGYVGLLATAVYDTIFETLVGTEALDLGLGPQFEQAMAMMEGGPGLLVQALLGPIALAIGVMVIAALNHLGLKLVGGASRDFEATFRVCAYSKAPGIVSLVPLCGPFVALVWTAVLSIIGLQTVHGTTLGKATTAVLLPFVVACCCCGGSLGLLAALMASVSH